MTAEKKWVSLGEAILVAIRELYEDGDRLASIMTAFGWRKDDPGAEEVYNYTQSLLRREMLPQGVISGSGVLRKEADHRYRMGTLRHRF
jgi:hypothetical protein